MSLWKDLTSFNPFKVGSPWKFTKGLGEALGVENYTPTVLTEAPWTAAADQFKSREGHPFMQSMARNQLEQVVGPRPAGALNRRFLGDQPPPAATIPFVPNSAMTAQPMVKATQGNPALEQLLAQFLQSR